MTPTQRAYLHGVLKRQIIGPTGTSSGPYRNPALAAAFRRGYDGIHTPTPIPKREETKR